MLHAIEIAVLIPALVTSLVTGLRDDPGAAEGRLAISALNSHVEIRTRRVDRVVAVGPLALGPLLAEMRRPDVSVDTFVKCYSACDQILQNAGLTSCVRWRGGHIDFDKNWRATGISRIDGFNGAFRREQIAEIISEVKALRIRLLAD
jgi:hypothetical protein